jgi:hypothetical protein
MLISAPGGRFPRAIREPPRRKLLRGLAWLAFSAGVAAFCSNQQSQKSPREILMDRSKKGEKSYL